MAQTFNNGDSNLSVRTKLNENATELNSTTSALADKATPADIETAIQDSKVDSVTSGNMNSATSNAVYQAIQSLLGGYSGTLQDLYDLITSGLPPADAPINFIVDDEDKTADFTYASGFTNSTDYEYQINGGAITTVTIKPIIVPNEDIAIGDFKIRTKAVSGVNAASNWLTNPAVYTTITGRVFMVGEGVIPGDLIIDGEDTEAAWYPLQPDDVFKIHEGQYYAIKFRNISTDTGKIYFENDSGLITVLYQLAIDGETPMKNAVLDFTKSPSLEYGLLLTPALDYSYEKFIIDEEENGGLSNITIKGIHTYNVFDRGWRVINDNVIYNNGAGVKSISGLTIEDCKFSSNNEVTGSGIDFRGAFYPPDGAGYEGVDSGYIENLIMRKIVIDDGEYEFGGQNINGFLVQDITIINVNPNATHHVRIFGFMGMGVVERIKGTNHYGNCLD
jgi:hypothetical protein